jgi:hypothetical protein
MRQFLEKVTSVPVWMRPPHWRWQTALASRANPHTTVAPLRSDNSLYEASTFYRHVCSQREAYSYRKRVFPEMNIAFSWYAGANPRNVIEDEAGTGGWRGVIDALLLAGLPFDDFGSALGVDIVTDSIRLYHDTFFDVSSYLDSEPAVFVNVLGISDQKMPKLSSTDPSMLKLFAYTWGPDATLEYFFSKNKGSNKMHSRWLKQLANEIITRQAVTIAMDRRNLYKEECREVLELARKHWAMPEDEVSSVEEEMRRRFLHETVTLLDNQLRKADVVRAEKDVTRAQALAEVQI